MLNPSMSTIRKVLSLLLTLIAIAAYGETPEDATRRHSNPGWTNQSRPPGFNPGQAPHAFEIPNKIHAIVKPSANGPSSMQGSGAPHPGKAGKHRFDKHGPVIPRQAVRNGLAVIAEFSDTRLEDWQGEGINNETELADQLRRMGEHWAWISHETERFQWDIIRVKLPVALTPDAYPGWVEYRNAVGALIRQQIDVSQYDSNGDGVVDTAWIIDPPNSGAYPYMIGGASRNSDVNMFEDSQNSESVVAGATGNFNHEVAHTLGIPDLYGPYDTLHYLTLMSDSWALPPQDFTAFERSLLGWVTPRVISQTTSGVDLQPASDYFDAVRIPTASPSEYFLIEYRRRPDSGFGSSAPPYNGLAVYHVQEGSNQYIDPPLLKLEPADGEIQPGARPELDDFLYPENPNMQRPFTAYTYSGHQEVFRISNLRWAPDGGLAFDIEILPEEPGANLLQNSSFEEGADNLPAAWMPDAYLPTTVFTWETQIAQQGSRSASISSDSPNDARWIQTVSGLTPGQTYELCGWVRGENIVTTPDAQTGANISILGGFVGSGSLSGTFDWTQACVRFAAEADTVQAACRLGFYGSTLTGKAWCDNLTLRPLESAF